ncbi:MAG: SMC family ATPase, partial [Desulfomonilaceae bacterium]|nr:SMC family ATPase [Desulfomonilaceae bacterium]
MKPIKLVASAIGPYSGEQVLDFRVLGDRTLFLIHGPTGSGKTTILDAISFALYGECSGGEREIKRMRSDHADPSVPTEATLDFRLGKHVYRVYRRPEQQLPKKRGEGTTIRRAMAALYKRTGLEDDSLEGEVIASQWSKVTEAVEQLLGFRCDQFRQVVMLPQGQFRKLLLADSRERQAILEVLFRTELYRRIEEVLKRTAKDLENQVRAKSQHLQFILSQSETESVDQLRGLRKEMGDGLAEIRKSLEVLASQGEKAQEKLSEGRSVAERFRELSRARSELEALEARIEAVAKRRNVLERARSALPITAEERALNRRSEEAREAKEKLEAARRSVSEAREARERAARAVDRETGRQAERDEIRNQVRLLDDLTGRVKELEDAGKRLVEAQGRSTERAAEFSDAVKNLEECRRRVDGNTADREKMEAVAARRSLLEYQTQEAEKASKQLGRLLTLGNDQATISQELRDVDQRLEKALQAWERESADLASVEKAWFEGQAAALARTLTPDAPCPVCGSRAHPDPARSDAEPQSERSVANKRKKVQEIGRTLDEIRSEKAEMERRISEIRASASELRKGLGDLADKDRSEVEAEGKRLRRELAAAVQADKKRESLIGEAERLQASFAEAREIRDRAEAAKAEALAELKSAEAEIRTRKEGIPEEFMDLATLKGARQKAD